MAGRHGPADGGRSGLSFFLTFYEVTPNVNGYLEEEKITSGGIFYVGKEDTARHTGRWGKNLSGNAAPDFGNGSGHS